jgi:hypothetical protein
MLDSNSTSVTVLTNPVINGQLTVQVNKPVTLVIFNAEGKLIRKEKIGSGKQSISLNGLPKGLYTLLTDNRNAKKLILK